MHAWEVVVLASAVVSSVSAQVCSGTTTIQNSGDATALAACQTFTGDIVIQTDTSDNIALDGIERIEGSLRATNNSKITEISSNTLGSITQEFHLDQLQVLSSLKFPKLSRVQTISWNALAALQQLTFTTGVQLAATVDIENTQLNSLSGINLAMVQRFIITNNPYLKDINLQLGNITEALRIEANAPDLDVEFPNLMWAFNVTFRNCSKISIPSLASVNGSMGFYGGNYDTLAAPNLTSVGQTLSIVSNSKLSNISMPNLTTIGGGFQLANNSALEKIDGFGALKTVGGALDFKGNFKSVQLPSIGDVRGAFNLQSDNDVTDDCNHFKGLSGRNNVIKGKFNCVGSQNGGSPTSSGGGSSPSAKGAASIVRMSAASVITVFGFVAALFVMS